MALVVLPKQLLVDANGDPRVGAKAYYYLPTTTTPITVYTTGAYAVAHPSPVESVSGGLFPAVYVNPAVNSTYKLVIKTSAGAEIYSEDNIPALGFTQGDIGAALYPLTAAEIAVGVTPTNYAYIEGDPRRYGADPSNNSTPSVVTTTTTAVQAAINVAYQAKGMVWLGNGCLYRINAVSKTMANSGDQPLRIVGASVIGSGFVATSSLAASALLTFTSSNPATVLIEANLHLENFSIYSGTGSPVVGAHGLSLLGLSDVVLSSIRINGFDRNVDVQSSLIVTIKDDSQFLTGRTGIRIALVGTANTTNLIHIENCKCNNNTQWGIDYNGGSEIQLYGNDVEGNGTAADLTTGGIVLRGQMSPDLQEANATLRNNWLESNLGWSLLIESSTVGARTLYSIDGGQIIGAESGRAIKANASKLAIRNIQCGTPVPADTWDLTVSECLLENAIVTTLTDTGVTYPTYTNVTANGTTYYNGRVESATLTLTGGGTSPTASVTFIQQGDKVQVLMPTDLTVASTGTSCTMTGVPVRYRPAANRLIPGVIQDSGVNRIQTVTMGTTGIISGWWNGSLTGFTGAGNKGFPTQQFPTYSL